VSDMKFLLIAIPLFTMPFAIVAQNSPVKGTCLSWEEGDALHMLSCKPCTKGEFLKGKEPFDPSSTQFFQGRKDLFTGADCGICEFTTEPIDCKEEARRNDQAVSDQMTEQWNMYFYSMSLQSGNAAFVYGKNVILREQPSVNSKVVIVLKDRAPLKILDKTQEPEYIPKNGHGAYWFQVTVQGKKGWVYGKYVHPDPDGKK